MAWAQFSETAGISGSTGVFEMADADYRTLYIGAATGRDRFGLRGRIAERRGVFYRYEVTTAYLSRHAELLGRYHEQHGALPPENEPAGALPRFGIAAKLA